MRAFLLATAGTLLSGVLFSLAFPPLSWRPLAWVALAPFFLALRGVGLRAGLFLGWLWAIVVSLLVADALPLAVETYFLQPRPVAIAFAFMVWTVTGSVYYMGLAPVVQALGRRRAPLALPLLTAAAWAAFELLRGRLWTGSRVFTGNPWALGAYSQAGTDTVLQVAALAGPYGVSFLLAATGAGLAEVLLALRRERRLTARICAPLALPLLLTAAGFAYGAHALRAADDAGTPPVRVAAVQPDLEIGSQWHASEYGRNLGRYLELTSLALRRRPSLVLWPESALTFFLEDEPLYRAAIGRTLAQDGAELVVGGPRKLRERPDGALHYTNSVFLVEPDGAIAARYDKEELVPFAEFLPLRGIDFLRRRFERVRVFDHGAPSPPLPSRAGRLGVLTCNEAMLPEVAAARVRAGAEVLAAPSNDTWIQDVTWANRMFDIVALRAIEQRRYLVRASSSGPSAIVDPWGRVRARTEPFSRAVLVGDVQPRRELSLYGRVGDAFTVAGALAVAAFLALRRPERAAGEG